MFSLGVLHSTLSFYVLIIILRECMYMYYVKLPKYSFMHWSLKGAAVAEAISAHWHTRSLLFSIQLHTIFVFNGNQIKQQRTH